MHRHAGNLIVRQGTPGGKNRCPAHMDDSLMVTFIDDDGFLRFTTVGGVSPAVLYVSQSVLLTV